LVSIKIRFIPYPIRGFKKRVHPQTNYLQQVVCLFISFCPIFAKKILNGTSGRTKEEYQNVLVAVFHFYCRVNLGYCLSLGISNHDYTLRLHLLCEGDGYYVMNINISD